MDESLSPIRDALRKFCDQEVLPKREAMDGDPGICQALMRQLGGIGFLAPMLQEKHGGMGFSDEKVAYLWGEIVRANPSLALSVAAHGLLCCMSIERFGSEEQKARYLPKLATGERIGAWGVTEPGAGSDVQGIQTVATSKNNGFVLSGAKTLITNAPIADILIVYAKMEKASSPEISGFILHRDMPGVGLGKPMAKFGMQGSPTGEIFMENVEVAADQVLGKPGSGFAQITAGFNHERLYAGMAAAAIIRHCLETSLKYSSQRHAFGKPIIEHQAVQLKISHLYAQLTLIEATTRELLRMPADSPEFHLKVSALKIFAGQWAVQACLDTMQILGGLGYSRECDIERFMRDAKLFEIGGGTTDIQHLIIMKGLARKFKMA